MNFGYGNIIYESQIAIHSIIRELIIIISGDYLYRFKNYSEKNNILEFYISKKQTYYK